MSGATLASHTHILPSGHSAHWLCTGTMVGTGEPWNWGASTEPPVLEGCGCGTAGLCGLGPCWAQCRQCVTSVPLPAWVPCPCLQGTLPACCPLSRALSQCWACSRACGSRREGATRGAALLWLPLPWRGHRLCREFGMCPCSDWALALPGDRGCRGSCGPSQSAWLGRGRGAFPHIAFTMEYIKCRDVNGASRAGTAVTSVHLSIHPSIHSSICSSTYPPFVPSFLLKFSLSLSLSLFVSVSVSLCLSPWVLGFPCWHRRWKRTP